MRTTEHQPSRQKSARKARNEPDSEQDDDETRYAGSHCAPKPDHPAFGFLCLEFAVISHDDACPLAVAISSPFNAVRCCSSCSSSCAFRPTLKRSISAQAADHLPVHPRGGGWQPDLAGAHRGRRHTGGMTRRQVRASLGFGADRGRYCENGRRCCGILLHTRHSPRNSRRVRSPGTSHLLR